MSIEIDCLFTIICLIKLYIANKSKIKQIIAVVLQ